MNIDKTNNIAYVEGRAYKLIPIEQEKILICEIDGKKYYLGPESNKKMSWYDAKAWAKDVGGALLPREVAVMASKKGEICKHFQTDDWYWLDEDYDSFLAQCQHFGNGSQYYNTRTYVNYVRAVFVE